MKRAAIYARYSSENQRDESIDAQLSAIDDYIVILIVATILNNAN